MEFMKRWLLGLIFFSLTFNCISQGESENNSITSGQFSGEFCSYNAITDKLVFQFAIQAGWANDSNSRSANIIEHLVQYGGRALLHYALSSRFKVAAGFGAWSNPDAPEAGQYNYNELRSFVQLKHYYTPRRVTLTNRIRLEQRFVQNKSNTAYEYKPRIRYSPKVVYALNSNVVRAKTIHSYGMCELFMTPGLDPFVKQVRALIGVGYNFTQDVSLEIDYGWQLLYSATEPDFRAHIIGVTLNYNNAFQW